MDEENLIEIRRHGSISIVALPLTDLRAGIRF